MAQKTNSKLLSLEDAWFSRPHYANALAQYLAANNITAEEYRNGYISEEEIDKARAYAIKEAQKATYRDINDFSDFIMKLGKRTGNETSVQKTAKILIDGVLPFRKTPANILVRAAEYSPLGFGRGLKTLAFGVRKGEKTVAEAIDQMASGLTGSGLMFAGWKLAALGVLVAKSGDDDELENSARCSVIRNGHLKSAD